jgi:sugar lactone lactonase YvrE
VDQQGHAYICGGDSDDIHRLSPDGTLRDIVLSKHDGVDGPSGITFNNDFLTTTDHSFHYTIS